MPAHQQEFRKVWALGTGLNSLATFLATNAPNMPHRATEWSYVVEAAPAAVAIGDSSMAAVTDGRQQLVGQGDTEHNVDLTGIHFFTAGANVKVSIFVRTK